MYPFFLCCGIKKVEPTHGTPPAAGIASFRSATTKYNIPSKTKAVKWIFSGIGSLCVFICSYSVCIKIFIPILNRLLRLLPPCVHIIQVSIGRLRIVIICTHSISNNTLSPKQIYFCRFRLSFHHINNTPAQLTVLRQNRKKSMDNFKYTPKNFCLFFNPLTFPA